MSGHSKWHNIQAKKGKAIHFYGDFLYRCSMAVRNGKFTVEHHAATPPLQELNIPFQACLWLESYTLPLRL